MAWTPDDWAPNFAGERVEVRAGCIVEGDKVHSWFVTVAGSDDTYRQRVFPPEDGALALRIATAITDGITFAELGEMGFVEG